MAYNSKGQGQPQGHKPGASIQYSTIHPAKHQGAGAGSGSGSAALPAPAYHAQNLSLGIGSDSGSVSPPRNKGKEVGDKRDDKDENKRSSINRVNRTSRRCPRINVDAPGAPRCLRASCGNSSAWDPY